MPRTVPNKQNSQTPIVSAPQKASDIAAKSEIIITINEQAIHIKAVTPNLILRSVEPQDVSSYQSIFADPAAMSFYCAGKPKLYKNDESKALGVIDYAQNKLVDKPNSWCNRWAQGNPFSAMTIVEKNSGATIGCAYIIAGEMAYFIDSKYWGKGYGSEAAISMCKAVLPAIVLSQSSSNIPKIIEATAHPMNIASYKILEKIGMVKDPNVTEARFGNKIFPRYNYKIPVQDLVSDYLRIKAAGSSSETKSTKPVLPLYQLHRMSDSGKSFNLINKGGYDLRYTASRKLRYST